MNEGHRHPDLGELDAVRTGDSIEGRAHAEACDDCAAELARLERIAPQLEQALEAGRVAIPDNIDRAIRDRIVWRAAAVGRTRRSVRSRLIRIAAAVLIAAGLFALQLFRGPAEEPAVQVALVGDMDHSGELDIVDAYLMARRIERHESVTVAMDLNADGRIDLADADRLARDVVSLDGVSR